MSGQQVKQAKNRNMTKTLIFSTTLSILFILIVLAILFAIDNEKLSMVLLCGMILLVVAMGFLLLLIVRFFKAADIVNESVLKMSQGKLNISDILVDKTKGLETLSIAFNDMKSNLLNFTESTKSNVIVLSDAIDRVSKSIDMSYKGNEQIAKSISTVAEKAQEQVIIVKDTIDAIEEVGQRIDNITSTLASIEEFVETTVDMTEEGSKQLDKYNEQMQVISNNLTDTSQFIIALNSHLKEIDQVSSFIINITEQLKMLALNASVEAARAGEAGKGFAVVAEEMNKLSSATRESIGRINKLITNITDSNGKVSSSINGCVDSYNISKEIFSLIKESFNSINNNAIILNDDMKKVYEEASLINANTQEISEKGITLYKASNEISSKTQEVAAVTEEELAENEEINNQALSLKNMLSGIERLLLRYKTSVMPVAKDSNKRLKIVMMSPLDHPFWRGVRQGVLYARNELKSKNVDVEYIGLEPMSNDRFIEIFKEKMAEGCDGMVVPGFVGGLLPHVQAAINKGITVMAFNCDFPEKINRLAYFGPDVYNAAVIAGDLMVKCLNGRGEVAIFRGRLSDSINKIRRDGVVQAISKKRRIKIVAEVEAVDDNVLVYNKVKEVIQQNPELEGIVITSGGAPGAAKAITELGRVGKTRIVCFDYDQEIFKLIDKDIVYAAMGQDPFGQGHDPIITVFNYLVTKEKPADTMYARVEVVDKRNVLDLMK